MKLIVEKGDLTWLQKNGYLGQEQVGIVWDQLAQKCNQIQEESSSSSQSVQLKNELSIPNVQGILLGEPKIHDICIAFSLSNGEQLARSLQTRMLQKKKKVVLASDTGTFDALEIEKRIASSTALVVLLTEECLKRVEVVFSLVVAKFYYQHPSLVMLVHDAESCYFPSYDEQPENVRDFFSEKAITFLSCYPEEGVLEIIAKFDNEVNVLENILENFRQKPTDALFQFLAKNESRQQFPIKELRNRMKPFMTIQQLDEFEVMADKNKDGTLDADELQDVLTEMRRNAEANEEEPTGNEEPTMEDLTTRVFLSHKRSTGQGIAGRFYEGLKRSYKVFIDSEAKFKIHNLKLIVQNTDVLVFILTYGILLSKWCLEELKAAIANKKRIIIVRELSFQYPDTLPEEWLEVEPVLRNSRELIWIAEYNSACVKALHNFIGSPDERHRPAVKYFSTREGKATLTSILNKFQSTHVLDLNRTIPLPPTVEVDAALDFVLESIPADKITTVHITSNAETTDESIMTGIFARLPNIKDLSLAESGGIVNNAIVKDLCVRYPLLQKLDLEQCIQVTVDALKAIKDLEQLAHLNLDKISELKDDSMEALASGCPKLEVLKISFADFTHKAFELVSKITNLKELEFPYLLKNHEDAKKFIADHPNITVRMEPSVLDCTDYSGNWFPVIVKSYSSTQTAIHFYGQSDYNDEMISKTQLGERTAAFGTHKHEYGTQDTTHATSDCAKCESLHETLKDVKFSGTPNRHFINDWYFSDPEGIESIKPYHEQAEKGQLQITNWNIPSGIKIPTFMKAIFDKYPEESIKELYLDPSAPEDAIEYLKSVPHLKFLSYRRSEVTLSDFQKIAEVFPPQLEELEFFGSINDECAELLASKIPNVTALHLLLNINLTELNEKGLLAFFKENSKLRSLTIRNCPLITADMVFKIAQNCKEIVNLNLTLDQKLVEQKDEVIVHLIKNFPALKKLVIDLPTIKSAKFEEFKTARPDVEVDFEGLYLKDTQDYYYNNWFPAIQITETSGPKNQATYHLYGVGRETTINLFVKEEVEKLKPFLSNSANFGAQDYHTTSECFYCSLLHCVCEKLKFQGMPNKFFQNDWFFEGDEGKALVKKFVPHGTENRITFDVSLPDGIREWAIVRSLAKELDLQKTYTLNFPNGANEIAKVCEQPLPISGLEFGQYSYASDDHLQKISEKLPKLNRLVLEQSTSVGDDGWNKMNLPELQYLDVSGCVGLKDNVIDGIAKSTKLTNLNLSQTGLTDKSIEVLAKNWSNLTSLNLRMLTITEKSLELICQHCPDLQSLNLILCTKVPATACKFIQEGLPKLKELKVPFHWTHAEAFAQLKAARPDVTYVEKSELIDASHESYGGAWYPSVILNETAKSYMIHYYGFADGDNNIWVPNDSPKLAPIFTNKEKYGKQKDTHFATPCSYCEILHPLCEHFKFGTSKNIAFINDWFFESFEGKQLINQIASTAKTTGKLELGINLPSGLSYEKTMKAVAESIPAESLRHISFNQLVSSDTLQDLLTDKPSLLSLSFSGAFKDEHMAVVANKCETLTNFALFACDVTTDGILNLASKLTNLDTLSIKVCKNITDKGMEALLLGNRTLDTVHLDFQHQLTGSTVRLLAKLPRLQTAALSYKLGQKDVLDEANALKKKKPLLNMSRGEVLLDCTDASGYWYPSFATEFDEVEKKFKVHFYGWNPESYDTWIAEAELATRVTETFTHTTNYGGLSSSHLKEGCPYCKQLHSMCRTFSFAGSSLSYYMH